MKIIPLSEGSFTIDKTKVFVPFQQATDDLQDRSVGSLLVEVQPFAIVTSKDILLIDTGLGFYIDEALQIHNNLKAAGIQPENVTKVLLSHLHKDHAGGVSKKDQLGNYTLAFPNATYYLQQKELDYAFEVGFPSYMIEELGLLQNNTSVVMLDGDGLIDGYIKYKVEGGHSPYHQSFWIEENGQILFFGGDNAPQLGQMKRRFTAKYDFDGKKAMELRQQWWEKGQQEDWHFLFYHDIKTPFYPAL
jgi:glyoxylase-like metal-dependent hydrolase (beta-lactamase superfamily II)